MARLSSLPCARILVLGDSGVGKTSLVNAIAAAAAGLTNPHPSHDTATSPSSASSSSSSSAVSWTVGCACVTVLLPTVSSSPSTSLSFVELFDVGGHRKYSGSRSMFYRGVDALLLVFDLTNRKSYNNLARWIRELVDVDRERSIQDDWLGGGGRAVGGGKGVLGNGGGAGGGEGMGMGGVGLSDLPVLVVGTKADMVESAGRGGGAGRTFDCMADYGLEIVTTAATARGDRSLAALLPFIQRAIERKEKGARVGERGGPSIGSPGKAPALYNRKTSAAGNGGGGGGGGGRLGSWRGGEEAELEDDDADDGLTIDIAQLHTLAAALTAPAAAHAATSQHHRHHSTSTHHTHQHHHGSSSAASPRSSSLAFLSPSTALPASSSSPSPLSTASPRSASSAARWLPSSLQWLPWLQREKEPRSRV